MPDRRKTLNVVVKHDATLARTVVHDHVYIGPAAHLRGCIVGRSADLRRGARAEEGVVLGEECELVSHVVLDGHLTIGRKNRVFPFACLGIALIDGSPLPGCSVFSA